MVSRTFTPCLSEPRDARFGNVVGACALAAVLSAPWWIYQLFVSPHGMEYVLDTSDLMISAITVPTIVAVSLAGFFSVSVQERWLRPILATGLALKIASSAAYLYLTMEVYAGSADISHYLWAGKQLAIAYETMGKLPILAPFYNTNFVTMVTGVIMIVLGQTVAAPMVVFAIVGYWGQYCFYRAFCVAFPQGDRRMAALFCFLTPSLLFWTSAVSKDALMMPAVGLTCLGFAKVNARPDLKGFGILAGGLIFSLIVRPHIAAMLAVSLVVAYLLGQNLAGMKGIVAKVVGIPLLILGTLYLVMQAQVFMDMADFTNAQHTVNVVAASNRMGGSAFGESSLVTRVAYAPFLMFRPFPWEARNLQSVIAAAEGFFLMLVFWRKRWTLLSVVRTARRDPFTFFILVYALEMCVALAGGMTNFGLLVRQRVMMVPPVLLLLCVSPEIVAARRSRPAWVEHLYAR